MFEPANRPKCDIYADQEQKQERWVNIELSFISIGSISVGAITRPSKIYNCFFRIWMWIQLQDGLIFRAHVGAKGTHHVKKFSFGHCPNGQVD